MQRLLRGYRPRLPEGWTVVFRENQNTTAEKTPLLNLIGGLDVASSGSISYGTEDITQNPTCYRAQKTEIIIADEPTGNLDSAKAKNVFESPVNMKTGKYIVVVSHDIEMAQKYGDRIITISDGQIVDDSGPKKAVEPEDAVQQIMAAARS